MFTSPVSCIADAVIWPPDFNNNPLALTSVGDIVNPPIVPPLARISPDIVTSPPAVK